MPMSKEEKNAAARAKRAAAKQASQQPTEPSIDVMADDAIASILSEHSMPVVSGPIEVDGHWVEEAIDANVKAAETLVESLLDLQDAKDKSEHEVILSMFDQVAQGHATAKQFAECYGARASKRGWSKTTTASRKSNLRGVIAFSTESVEFREKVTATPMGLQAMYALRAEMLKLAAPESEVKESVQAESDDDASSMNPHDLVLHQINNAIDAAANAGYDDIAEQLRAVFYSVKDKEPAEALI